jgi:hypothetical protein
MRGESFQKTIPFYEKPTNNVRTVHPYIILSIKQYDKLKPTLFPNVTDTLYFIA